MLQIKRYIDLKDYIYVFQGGNDYHLYEDPRTVGHAVTGPDDTIKQLKELFF